MTAPALPLATAEATGRGAKAALVGLLAAGVAGLLLSIAYWWVNLDWALRHAAGNPWPALDGILQGLLPSAVLTLLAAGSRDASTIAPLIALIFCWSLLRGAATALRAPERVAAAGWQERRSYPFSPGFERTWVQLGLIGTLWSFLLLGGSMRSGVDADATIEILVVAFSTALVSTLAGVVAAYVLAPGAIALFRLALPRELAADGDTGDLLAELERGLRQLVDGAREAAVSLAGERRRGDASLRRRLDDAGLAVQRFGDSLADPRLADRLREVASEVAQQIEAGLGRRLARLEGRTSAHLVGFARSLREGLRDLAGGIERGQSGLAERLLAGLNGWQAERERIDDDRRARQEAAIDEVSREVAEVRRQLAAVEARVTAGRADLDAVAERMTRELREELARHAHRTSRRAAAGQGLLAPRRGALGRLADRLGRWLEGE